MDFIQISLRKRGYIFRAKKKHIPLQIDFETKSMRKSH